ncbi:MAG: hypothetical protein OEY14_11870, partial [Myxococcales bacterium]|nr:hypothetical protein [Myxococcales bacterium]
ADVGALGEEGVGLVEEEDGVCVLGEGEDAPAVPVTSGRRWPGVNVLPEQIGKRTFEARRPEVYFDPENPEWPETVEIAMQMPKELLSAHGDADAAREAIATEVQRLERKARRKLRELGHGFGTPQSAVQTKFTRRARSFEFFGVLDPTFAAAGDTDAALAIIERNRSFLRDYADCLGRFQRGERDIIWPAGTWKMRVRYRLPTKPPP